MFEKLAQVTISHRSQAIHHIGCSFSRRGILAAQRSLEDSFDSFPPS
jgi:hypothetical protein